MRLPRRLCVRGLLVCDHHDAPSVPQTHGQCTLCSPSLCIVPRRSLILHQILSPSHRDAMDGSPSRGSDTTGPVSPPTSPSIRSISPPTRRSKKSSRKMVYVSIPTLSEVEKAAYKSFSEDPIPFGDEYFGMSFHTIIGEYKDGSVLYYFARPVENAQAFKVRCPLFSSWCNILTRSQIPATRMRTSHPKLVEQYGEC